jgi:hypothetical protein
MLVVLDVDEDLLLMDLEDLSVLPLGLLEVLLLLLRGLLVFDLELDRRFDFDFDSESDLESDDLSVLELFRDLVLDPRFDFDLVPDFGSRVGVVLDVRFCNLLSSSSMIAELWLARGKRGVCLCGRLRVLQQLQ